MTLTWWEWEELVDHFRLRPDLWHSETDEELVWTRLQDEIPVMGLLATLKGTPTSHYRTFQVNTIPVGWNEQECSDYLDRLVDRWSSYRTRTRVFDLLTKELKIDEKTANLAAIAIVGFDSELRPPDPETVRHPTQDTFWGPDYNWYLQHSIPHSPIFQLKEGGYLALRKSIFGYSTEIRFRVRDQNRTKFSTYAGHVRVTQGLGYFGGDGSSDVDPASSGDDPTQGRFECYCDCASGRSDARSTQCKCPCHDPEGY